MGHTKSPLASVKANGFVNRGSAVQSCSPAPKAQARSESSPKHSKCTPASRRAEALEAAFRVAGDLARGRAA